MPDDKQPIATRYRAYVGAGAHATPADALALMRRIARLLAKRDYTLRSGGSPGADEAFEEGCGDGPKEIYLPTPGFNGNPSPLFLTAQRLRRIRRHDVWRALRAELVGETPPVELDALPALTQRLYARDVLQVLGWELASPAERVVCWRPAHQPEGTRITVFIARALGVPVEDLADAAVARRWITLLEGA